MKIMRHLILIIFFLNVCISWEFCKSDVQNTLCGGGTHFACDSKNPVLAPTNVSKTFLAHVPLTRKVKTSFLNWHNYYRNRTAAGWAENAEKVNFPRAVRMRELIWDNELSYLSHIRTKLVCAGEVICRSTQRFPFVAQNLVVTALNESKPVMEIIALSLRQMFDTKNSVTEPKQMPRKYLESHKGASQFITMVNDHVSRLGCAVALGADCAVNGNFCYYTACTYDADNDGQIYKIGIPTSKCSAWEVGRSEIYLNLCGNSGKIFKRDVKNS